MKQDPSGNHIVGVDLGGTNVRAAVTDREGRIIGDARLPSKAMEGPDITVPVIIEVIRDAISNAGIRVEDVRGIGMGVPGRHISGEGIVLWSPNFNGWGGLQLLAPIREAIGAPVYMGNDANVAALGEYRFGAAKGKNISHMVMMTLGTGIGGGIILHGKLWLGANEGGGEIGHQIINPNGGLCGCGNFGDLESMANRDAIIERAQRRIYMGRKTMLTDMLKPKYLELTPAMIAEAAIKGDEVAIEVMDETGYFVGIGVANTINFLNIQMFVIGGGISQAGPVLWDPIMRTVRANALEEALEVCQVAPAALGDDAGVLGGVVLVLEEMGE